MPGHQVSRTPLPSIYPFTPHPHLLGYRGGGPCDAPTPLRTPRRRYMRRARNRATKLGFWFWIQPPCPALRIRREGRTTTTTTAPPPPPHHSAPLRTAVSYGTPARFRVFGSNPPALPRAFDRTAAPPPPLLHHPTTPHRRFTWHARN
jgi:hypothetical protein